MALYGASALCLTQISSHPARLTVNQCLVHKRDRALFYATKAECISRATSWTQPSRASSEHWWLLPR